MTIIPIIPITPHYSTPTRSLANPQLEKPSIQDTIRHLGLTPHVEGGYFSETDRDVRRILRKNDGQYDHADTSPSAADKSLPHRSLSTNIFYLLTPMTPLGAFHSNRSRTIHTLHRGRGVYVVLKSGGGREVQVEVETFVVGHDVARGEKLQWIVEGGDYKATFLIPDRDGKGESESKSDGLLISETVIPGFEYDDHDFLKREDLQAMVGAKEFEQLQWLLRENYTQGSDFP
ncbi:hypothetical protein BO70DRAFT_296875 [Aspergillus heteromorphus CBS 117.55]|uniref:DUF985 domain-containing protein n=1 Tax=Aspergillus heteromorphus CBS 117.55 TaxID=1448321 RepID=A0A317VM38_9EURO|nr:uncharacterized protein BO70DRAFT_296875 [Aspergillus heteromorphus CBS 117.55]PWY74291.1 hypothetical protein BO70DRAFT_296875 [Aspergillus heteromorphus CBS 117.55]